MGIIGKNAIGEGVVLSAVDYPWALKHFNDACHNSWFPSETPLDTDLGDLASGKLSEADLHAVGYLLKFFTPNELIVNKALALGVFPHITAPEVHMYLARQMYEEANHCAGFQYLQDTYDVDREEFSRGHIDIPVIAAKEAFETKYITRMLESRLDMDTDEGVRDLLRNLVAYSIIMEGIWFYSGFAVAKSFGRRNLLAGLNTIVDWVVKDESIHLQFGVDLITTILAENPNAVTPAFADEVRAMILDAVEMEIEYNEAMIPRGLMGINAAGINGYVRFLADRRLEELGFEAHYGVSENPLDWMAGEQDLPREPKFFEVVNTDYNVGAQAASFSADDVSHIGASASMVEARAGANA